MPAASAVAVAWFAVLTIGAAKWAAAADILVPPGDGLRQALAQAAPGDTLHLQPGLHQGGVVIATPRLTLQGEAGAIVDGGGQSSVIRVTAKDVTIRRLTVRHSGLDLLAKDSGIYLDRTAGRAVIEDNDFSEDLTSVYVWGPQDVTVQRNRMQGLTILHRSERGSGVSLWDTAGTKVLNNIITDGRDGVFTPASHRNIVRGNRFSGVRFAVHFMYNNDSEVADNSSSGNDSGYVLMFSARLRVHDNVSDHDHDHAFLFDYANDSDIRGNVARSSEQCVFIYNANGNRFSGNWFEGCTIGVHFTAGSERNVIAGNAFIANRTQVMYVGTHSLDWSAGGRGNYWSDDASFDLDGDGIADEAYRPNDLIDQVIWRAPAAILLTDSPAVQVVRWAQSQFPAIHPGGVIDSAPLMMPPRPAALARLEAAP